MIKRLFIAALTVLSLTQCSSLRSDCRAIAEREADIARETPGDYYVGRRYYLPTDQGSEARAAENLARVMARKAELKRRREKE